MAIVLITAYKLTVEEEKAVMEQAGADKLLNKPLPKFDELREILEKAIGERREKAGCCQARPKAVAKRKISYA